MNYNKIDFINDLLSSKKIKIEEKSRIIDLTKNELKNFEADNSELKLRVDKIEKILDVSKSNISESSMEHNAEKISKVIYYTNYKNQARFLQKLNNNSFTKFLTHDVDSNDYRDLQEQFGGKYNYLKHLKKIKEVFSVLTEKKSEFIVNFPELERIPISPNLYTKIYNYINNEKGWGEENIKMNWSHQDLLNWSEEHPELTPTPSVDLGYEGFRFGDKTFKDLVLDFKNEIHIRRNNSLDFILTKVMFEPQNDFRAKIVIEKNINDALEFFTDVEKLKQIIRLIFNLIIEKHQQEEKPKVTFTFKTNEKKIELSILHINSVYGQDIETLRFGKTLKNLMKVGNGLCDIEIKY
jgi:hypothetical protein